jgi:DNA-binding CsgD family transcriptional regulator
MLTLHKSYTALDAPQFSYTPLHQDICRANAIHLRISYTICEQHKAIHKLRGLVVSEVELLLRSRLVTEALSPILTEAGFVISYKQNLKSDNIISIIDFDAWKDQEIFRAYQLRGVKIVALAGEAHSLEISPDELTALSGLLTYDLSANTFVQSLRLICSGERVFPRDVALERDSAAQAPGTKPPPDGVRLSPREREVLSQLVEGHPNKIIAWRLGLSEATAKIHVKNLMRKIRVDNRTQAAIWALANLPGFDPASSGFV